MALQLIKIKCFKNNFLGLKTNWMHTYTIKDYQLHKLKNGPNVEVAVDYEVALDLYRKMQSIRKLESNIANLFIAKRVRGFCHLSIGQEACAVGIHAAMRPQDGIISGYRVHGWCYLMSKENAFGVISELLGKRTGVSRGRGGSMHLFAKNFYGGQSIVGAQVPLGTGLAFAAKYLDNKAVCFTLYGDGAANQGQVFEAFNMAALWNLPCIFVCENNEYGMGTSAARSSGSLAYYTRGDYIPGILVNGMDVLAVREASRFAIDYCMNGNGPIILELKTYRYYGHFMSESGANYRKREEVLNVRLSQDPIKTFVTKITKSNLVGEDELQRIDVEIKKKIDEMTQKALKENELPVEDLTMDIYKMNREGDIRGCTPFTYWKHNNQQQEG